jgi:hypothetical protein
VPRRKSDVYIASRKVGYAVKASLHEPGPARIALTSNYVRQPDAIPVPGDDPRHPIEWERARPRLPDAPMTRAFAIIVPWDEVRDRGYPEKGDVVRTPTPAVGNCIEYDVMYAAAGLEVEEHPGARSMGTRLVGHLDLANGEQVFVVSWEHEITREISQTIERIRSARVVDQKGDTVDGIGALAFGSEAEGYGTFLDVTITDIASRGEPASL